MRIETDKSIAVEILRQLGNHTFLAMTGAKNLISHENGLSFRLSGSMTKDRINYVKITLNAMDTYDIEFGKVISRIEGIYNDMLKKTIENNTGLYLNL